MKKFEKATALFDAYNLRDPNLIFQEGTRVPKEYFYAVKRTEWVKMLDPKASEYLLLAAHCQHIGRWAISRTTYPDGRLGYLKWRSDLGKYHAMITSEILEEVGYASHEIDMVTDIILKHKIKQNRDVQIIEDALCLVFLEYQFNELIEKHSDEKMITILRKTWAKMSPAGHDYAMRLSLSPKGRGLIEKSLL